MEITQGNTMSAALQQAIMARQGGQPPVGQLSQTGPSSPPSIPQSASFNANPASAPASAPEPQLPEVQILEKALMDRIRHISSLEKQSAELSKPIGTSQPSLQSAPVAG